jgi:hypothetical protein
MKEKMNPKQIAVMKEKEKGVKMPVEKKMPKAKMGMGKMK